MEPIHPIEKDKLKPRRENKEERGVEREGAKMHVYVVVKMAEVLEPKDLIFLAQQATDEARLFKRLVNEKGE